MIYALKEAGDSDDIDNDGDGLDNEGEILWNFTANGTIGIPTLYEDKMIFGTDAGWLYLIAPYLPNGQVTGIDDDGDNSTDEEVYDWTNNDRDYYVDIDLDGFTKGVDPIVLDNGTTPFKLDEEDYVLNGTIEASMYGSSLDPLVDEDCTRELWTYYIGDPVSTAPAVVDYRVYVGTDSGDVHSVNFETAKVVWESSVGGAVTSVAVRDGLVFVGSSNGINALYADTGEEMWNAPISSTRSTAIGSSLNSHLLFVSSGNVLNAMNERTGSIERTSVGASAPIIGGEIVVVSSTDGTLYAYDLGTGAVVWSYSLGILADGLAIADRLLLVGAADKVYAIWDGVSGGVKSEGIGSINGYEESSLYNEQESEDILEGEDDFENEGNFVPEHEIIVIGPQGTSKGFSKGNDGVTPMSMGDSNENPYTNIYKSVD
jgi:outer membrane protein assembly factor BamB